jgi:hypothetical protein
VHLVAQHEDLDFLGALAAHDQDHQVQHLAPGGGGEFRFGGGVAVVG